MSTLLDSILLEEDSQKTENRFYSVFEPHYHPEVRKLTLNIRLTPIIGSLDIGIVSLDVTTLTQ